MHGCLVLAMRIFILFPAAAAGPQDPAVATGLRVPLRRHHLLPAPAGREEQGRRRQGPPALDRNDGGGEVRERGGFLP